MNKFKTLVGVILFTFSAACLSQGLDFKLSKIQDKNSFCTIFFDTTNNTNLNITLVNAQITLREGDGSIIHKQALLYNRIKKGETEASESLNASSCGAVKAISVQVRMVYVDGEIGSDKMISIADSGKRTSLVKGVTLK